MIYLVLLISFFYATLILLYKTAWNKISESKEVNYNDKVSVVVACRNEETNIKNLIKDISKDLNLKTVTFMDNEINLNKKFNKISMNNLVQKEFGCDVLSMDNKKLYKLCVKYKLDIDNLVKDMVESDIEYVTNYGY